jgi:uncharacterized protein (DUF433 family)
LRINQNKVRGWIAGYPSRAEAILQNDIGWIGNTLAFSFANLMEIRFLQHFAALGVKVRSIRAMAAEARAMLEHPHPFATKTVFETDGKKIFAKVAEQTGDKKLYDLKAKNWTFLEVIEQSLNKEVHYDPAGDAAAWKPRPERPNVIIHPRWAFGQPVVTKQRIPTRALFEAFNVEGATIESVAAWYEVPKAKIEEAIGFEAELAMAA